MTSSAIPSESSPVRSLSFLVPFWSGLVIAGAMLLYGVFQYYTVPDVTIKELLFHHLWHVFVLGGLIQLCCWLMFRRVLVQPIEEICAHLYRVGTGRHEPLEMPAKVLEVQKIVEGINAMVRRGQLASATPLLDVASDVKPEHASGSNPGSPAGSPAGADSGSSSGPSAAASGVPPVVPYPGQGERIEEATPWISYILGVIIVVTAIAALFRVETALNALDSTGNGAELQRIMDQLDDLASGLSRADQKVALLATELQRPQASPLPTKTITEPVARPSLPAENQELRASLARLGAQIADMDARLVALLENSLAADALDRFRDEFQKIVDIRTAQLGDDHARLDQALGIQLDRVAEIEGNVDGLQEGAPRGFWRAVENFIQLADAGFQGSRGARTRAGKQESGVSRYLSRNNFPGAEATNILESRGARWCEVILFRGSSWAEGQRAYYQLKERIDQELPLGWTSTALEDNGDLPAARLTGPGGTPSFYIGMDDYDDVGSRSYVSVMRFGNAP